MLSLQKGNGSGWKGASIEDLTEFMRNHDLVLGAAALSIQLKLHLAQGNLQEENKKWSLTKSGYNCIFILICIFRNEPLQLLPYQILLFRK